MAKVRREIGRSTRNGEEYWFARERRTVIGRADTERKLKNQLKKRDDALAASGYVSEEEEEEVDNTPEEDVVLLEDE